MPYFVVPVQFTQQQSQQDDIAHSEWYVDSP